MIHRRTAFCVVLVVGLLAAAGCTTNMRRKTVGGAAVGSFGGAFVGAMTDLILDGEVNTDALARNAVSGAIAGGMAGATVGYKQDKDQAARPQTPPANEVPDQDLLKRIGKDNYDAAIDLVYKRHEDAYRKALKSAVSKNPDYQRASLALQALIDLDRGNTAGVDEAINAFAASGGGTNEPAKVRQALDELHAKVKEERKIRGIQ
jgi:hypothetical protein